MRRRRPWIAAVLVLSVIAALAIAGSTRRSRPATAPAPVEQLPATTDEAREQICRRVFVDFADQITQDAAADQVTGDLVRTLSLARAAADRDPAMESLAGGVGALLESLDTDDPGAATIALRVLRGSCGELSGP